MELPPHHHHRPTLVEENRSHELKSDSEKCEKIICYSDGQNKDDENYDDDLETEENRTDKHFDTRVSNVDASLEDSSDDIFPSAATYANPIEPLNHEQEYLEDDDVDIAIDQPSANGDCELNDHENNSNSDFDNEHSNPSNNSGIRSSTRNRIPKRVFDYDQLNGETEKMPKRTSRKSVQSNVVQVKKVEPKIVEEDYNDDGDDREEEDDDDKEEETKRNQTVIL